VIAAMGLLIGVLARRFRWQGVLTVGNVLFQRWDAWFPQRQAALADIGQLMPSAAAMTGYQNIPIRGLRLSSAMVPAVLLAYALVSSCWRVRFRKIEISALSDLIDL
jgi:hypothetical protein